MSCDVQLGGMPPNGGLKPYWDSKGSQSVLFTTYTPNLLSHTVFSMSPLCSGRSRRSCPNPAGSSVRAPKRLVVNAETA
uniref:Uncharacterized protein n=1 Tax=Lutzomyia longipalpis TaxID=7200 RepID=A0A1B0EV65_LUTLO